MRRAAASAAVLLGAGLSACLNFAEPEPGPGRLEARLSVEDSTRLRAAFQARFWPGGDGDGGVPDAQNRRIRILEASVEPSDGSEGSLPDTLRVQHEALAGASGPLEASLNVILEATAGPGASGYGVTFRVTRALTWEVTPP